jgi:hypothetical protein
MALLLLNLNRGINELQVYQAIRQSSDDHVSSCILRLLRRPRQPELLIDLESAGDGDAQSHSGWRRASDQPAA